MRIVFNILIMLIFVTCSGATELYQPVPQVQVLRHLTINANLKGSKRVKLNDHVFIDMTLENISLADVYPVIKPGDGSFVGWREPHVFYTAEYRPENSDSWVPVSRKGIGRCGVYDPNWQKDIVRLAPGDSLSLNLWALPLNYALNMSNPGDYKVRVHYVYNRGGETKIKRYATDKLIDLGKMDWMPVFEIVSNPVEVSVYKKDE